MRRAPRPAVLCVLIAMCAATAWATTIRHLDLGQMTAAADTIVHGRVESVRSFWEGRQILTEVSLVVDRGLKGPAADRVSFVQVGGTVSSPVPINMTVPGAPVHKVGDEGFYFLEPVKDGRHVLVGLSLGRVQVLQGDQGAYVTHEGKRISPEAFEEQIRRAVSGQKDAVGLHGSAR